MLTVLQGDALERLRTLETESVQCCVTSPPYWGLRDYGTATWKGGDPGCDHLRVNDTRDPSQCKQTSNAGTSRLQFCDICGARRIDAQLGLEKTPDEYVSKLVAIFSEVRRVLRSDGTLWLNLGDSYANDGKWGGHTGGKHVKALHCSPIGRNKKYTGLKPKDLIGIPWMVAFALRTDGWWLRQDIIWSKPNPMPESVTDRCTKAHEYIFLLTKSARYFYDAVAISEPLAYGSVERLAQPTLGAQRGSDRVPGKTNGAMKAVYRKPYTNASTKDFNANGAQDASATKSRIVDAILSGELINRNKRSVWTVSTQPFREAHFATFPPDLIKPCILAGCPVDGTVLDPFAGSGTTGMVALELARKAVLIELNPEYYKLIEQRCNVTPGLPL